jgi:hypothetical protein
MHALERNHQPISHERAAAHVARPRAQGKRVARRARTPQAATQIASRFAKIRDQRRAKTGGRFMTNKLIAAGAVALALSGFAGAAQAQSATPLTNGSYLTLTSGARTGSGVTTVDLGSAGVTGVVSQMPMSLSYASVNLGITFQGNASLYYGTTSGIAVAPVDTNYLRAGPTGSVTLDFSQAQRYFSMRWGSQGNGDSVAFYDNGQLVSSLAGSTVRPMSIALTGTSQSYTTFSFSELTFDRVVLTGGTTTMEVGAISFSDSPQIAPIPLNAASLGGLLAFLGMMGARGGGAWRAQMRLVASGLLPGREKGARLA